MKSDSIVIRNARVNNLKNVSLSIPRGKLVVVTGVSGSGKSSLAFDTLFAEGQRRFAQSMSSYARQFLGRMSKPDVDYVEGIPPAVAIEQKVNIKNPRSTVATTTEIYDYLRLVFARIGRTYSPISGEEVSCDNPGTVVNWLEKNLTDGKVAYLLAPVKWGDAPVAKLLTLKEQGFSRLFRDGQVERIDDFLQSGNVELGSDAYVLVDRFRDLTDRTRLLSSINTSFSTGEGDMEVFVEGQFKHFCERFERDGMKFAVPTDYMFSFNSPLGACPECGGLGKVIGISEDLVIPDKSKSIYDGAIACWRGEKMSWFKDLIVSNASKYGIDIFTPYCKLSEKTRDFIWNARSEKDDPNSIVGINEFFEWVDTQKYKIQYKYMLSRFSGKAVCPVCHGSRLKKEALYVKVAGKNINEVLSMTVDQALSFFESIRYTDVQWQIVREAHKEIVDRVKCLVDVGLGYLSLNRSCNTLSGGESQRVNLVSALGSSLVGSMYVLDEPSVGLHPRDTQNLLGVLKQLRDLGNTVIVVEHDEEIIRAADVLIDMGPRAGSFGGEVVFEGKYSDDLPQEVIDKSLTLRYLKGQAEKYKREKRTANYFIELKGVMEHNLKGIDVKFPLGVLTVVSGVSGSGKSTLVGDVLYPALYRHINGSGDAPGAFKSLEGSLDRISAVEYVDQNPIGKSTRSNPVTYLKIYDLIRKLLSDQPLARLSGFGPSWFSFNQDGGRCPECQGEGVVTIPMQFMSDVTMVCEACGGKRFKPDILEVKYRGKNVDDILNMSVREAIEFFRSAPEREAGEIADKLQPLVDVGLDYLKLAQSSSTLSGGESQRIKLAYFLSMGQEKAGRGRTLFIFDEPTTGLHFHDVDKLLRSFDALLQMGHSILVVEHNPDVIKAADYLIDLGPDAGERGGEIVYAGPPEEVEPYLENNLPLRIIFKK
ncbi:MAG: excinuclease ABC subunit UvrA [Bacteroidales bacterium]|nr:excinuclease ABC subunit UvrA [Bacteroidales bacterium]